MASADYLLYKGLQMHLNHKFAKHGAMSNDGIVGENIIHMNDDVITFILVYAENNK